jgi:NTP pyrophosphatase (non-canonical NTP hydrolase)
MDLNDKIPIIAQKECAEVIQAISKVYRFGLHCKHNVTGITNRSQLETELGQLIAMIHMLQNHWDLDNEAIMKGYDDKYLTINKWDNYFPKG